MKKLKKAFVIASVLFTTLVILIAVATTLLVNHLDTTTHVTTKTCLADGTHCTSQSYTE